MQMKTIGTGLQLFSVEASARFNLAKGDTSTELSVISAAATAVQANLNVASKLPQHFHQ
jgi:hypothetical protein